MRKLAQARHLIVPILFIFPTMTVRAAVPAPTPQAVATEDVAAKYQPKFESLKEPTRGDEEVYNPLVFDYVCDVLDGKGSISKADFDRFDIPVEGDETSFYTDLRFYGADGRSGEYLSVRQQGGKVLVIYGHHSWNVEKQDMDDYAVQSRTFANAKVISMVPGLAQETPAYKAYVAKGKKFLYQGKFDQAIENYQKAQEIDPDSPKIYNYIGYAQILSNKPSEAIESLKTSIQKDPSYALAHYNLSIADWMLQRKNESVVELDKAMRLEPALAKAAPQDEHTKPILDSKQIGNHGTVFEFKVGPPAGIEWGLLAVDSSWCGSIIYDSFEMADDKNGVLAHSVDAGWILAFTGYALTQNSEEDPVHKVALGIGACSMLVDIAYPPISMADGYLSGNNGKGERGLIGTGLDALALASIILYHNNGDWDDAALAPQYYRDGAGIKFAMRF